MIQAPDPLFKEVIDVFLEKPKRTFSKWGRRRVSEYVFKHAGHIFDIP